VEIERIRQQRGALIQALPIPEFARGGLVNAAFSGQLSAISTGQGKILAFLHRGEAVLNARAVAALGPSFIERANRAPGFQSGGFVGRAPFNVERSTMNVTVNVFAAPGMSEAEVGRQVVRQLERTLNDRGHSLRR
jgi:hypothetical protein